MKYNVGQKASYSKRFDDDDVRSFARLSGDCNPIHLDEDAAETSLFGKRIVHGMFVLSLVSTVLGMYLPGPGTIYLSQDVKFLKPVYIGESVTAVVEIAEIDDKNRARLKTSVINERDERVIEGEAYVILPY